MFLQVLTGIAQIASAVAIVLSLIFVGVQLRQAIQAVRASSSQAHAAMYQALSAGIVDNFDGFARIWRKGLGGTETLTDDERARFFAFTSSQLRFFESARVQWLRRQLDQEHWRGVTRQAQELASEPGVQEFWAAHRHWHCIHFQRWFDSLGDDRSAPSRTALKDQGSNRPQ